MIALFLAALLQTAEPPPAATELPPGALRDPHGYVLSQCSPLVLPRGADPAACEARVWTQIQAVRPEVGPRPLRAEILPAAGAPASVRTPNRCRALPQQGEIPSGGAVVCGSDNRLAEDVLGRLLR